MDFVVPGGELWYGSYAKLKWETSTLKRERLHLCTFLDYCLFELVAGLTMYILAHMSSNIHSTKKMCFLVLAQGTCADTNSIKSLFRCFKPTDSWSNCEQLLPLSETGDASHNTTEQDISFVLSHISLFPLTSYGFSNHSW